MTPERLSTGPVRNDYQIPTTVVGTGPTMSKAFGAVLDQTAGIGDTSLACRCSSDIGSLRERPPPWLALPTL